MTRLTELAHAAIRATLRQGEVAIDGTAGNGHDSELLTLVVDDSNLSRANSLVHSDRGAPVASVPKSSS